MMNRVYSVFIYFYRLFICCCRSCFPLALRQRPRQVSSSPCIHLLFLLLLFFNRSTRLGPFHVTPPPASFSPLLLFFQLILSERFSVCSLCLTSCNSRICYIFVSIFIVNNLENIFQISTEWIEKNIYIFEYINFL